MPAADATAAPDRQRRVFLIVAIVAALAFAVVATLVRARAGGDLDGRVVDWFQLHRHAKLTSVAIALDHLGRWWLLGSLVILLVGALWWSGRMVQAVYLGVTVGASLLLNLALKLVFQRYPPGGEPVVKALSLIHISEPTRPY